MFSRLGFIVSRWWLLVLAFWVSAVVAVRVGAPRWDDVTHDGDFAYLPREMPSSQGERLLISAFPDTQSKSQIVLVVAREGEPLKPIDFLVADRLAVRFAPTEAADDPVVGLLSHRTEVVGQKLLSKPTEQGQALLILLQLRNEFMAIDNMRLLSDVEETLAAMRDDASFPEGLHLGITGSAAIGSDMLFAAEESIRNTEWTTIALVLVILLAVYRAPGLVFVPLVTIGVSVVVATGLVALATQVCAEIGIDFKIFKTTRIFVIVILFGAGTDYCLFLIARYKEELQRGLAPELAIQRALAKVGDALVASALTTILGIGMMVFCSFGKFRNSGPAIALCLVVALAASMTLAPALLRAARLVVFWPWGIGPQVAHPESEELPACSGIWSWTTRFWEWIGRQILVRPGWIFAGSLVLLLPFAVLGLRTEQTYDLLSELQSDRPSVQGTELLRRYFPGGEIGPVSVLAYDPKGGLETDEGLWQRIQPLAEQLIQFRPSGFSPDSESPISTVRCLTAPLGERQKTGIFGTIRDTMIRRNDKTRSTYLAQAPDYEGKVTRFDLVFDCDPFSVESIDLLDEVEDYLCALADNPDSAWHGAAFYFVGTTAGIRDLRAVTAGDLVLIKRLVPIAVLAVLIVILRRPWICVYLILSVLLGYFVTIGITEAFFHWLKGADYHGLDWKVPMFLFVILIAVGQDYNVYLTTRVFEEQERHGPEEGVRIALIRTGGIITSCGVIMAGTFASMATGTLSAMHELGFALSLGILLDTFIIRTVVVPAFLVLWQRGTKGGSNGGARQATLVSDQLSEAVGHSIGRRAVRAGLAKRLLASLGLRD
jgi:RND superfamily putative drug exporter